MKGNYGRERAIAAGDVNAFRHGLEADRCNPGVEKPRRFFTKLGPL